jgi:hypothetical protein
MTTKTIPARDFLQQLVYFRLYICIHAAKIRKKLNHREIETKNKILFSIPTPAEKPEMQ